MAGRTAGQLHVDAHVRVIAQAGARTLRLGHEREAVAVDHRQPDQFAGHSGQTVDQRLREVDDAGTAQETEAERREFGCQGVVAVVAYLPHIAAAHQFRQQAMTGAARHFLVLRDTGQRHALRMAGQDFQDLQ